MARTCTLSGCDRPHEARGWCKRHYQRWRRSSDPPRGEARTPPRRCTLPGCDRPYYAKGQCRRCYQRLLQRWRYAGRTERVKCANQGKACLHCEREAAVRLMCKRHYQRWLRARDEERVRHEHAIYARGVAVAARLRKGQKDLNYTREGADGPENRWSEGRGRGIWNSR